MKKFAIALALGLSMAAAPPAYAAKKQQMTPMELQAIQSKEFETTKEAAFGAVMTVVQDLGYTVESADLPSGFITAASPTENKTGFLNALAGVQSSGNTTMTAFLMQMPSGMTRVRLNFVNSRNDSSAYGRSARQDKPILDPQVYRTAWDKIDEALFVMGALSSSAPDVKPVPSGETSISLTTPVAGAASVTPPLETESAQVEIAEPDLQAPDEAD